MNVIRIKLLIIWVVVMLIYLLGDVIRIFSGDFVAGQLGDGVKGTQWMYLGISVLMLLPILMVFLSLVLPNKACKLSNIILAIFFFLFNSIGLPTYPGLYDKFLLAVSLIFNGLTVWYAWKWAI